MEPELITGPGLYRTRDGAKVEIVGRNSNGYWVGTIETQLGAWVASGAARSGSVNDIGGPWVEPKSGTVWVNVYRDGHMSYSTRADADLMSCHGRIACVSVNWTEGEGL